MQTTYRSSYEISRGLGVTPRCLSLLTGNFHVSLDGKRFNLGLCVKDAQKGLCVPEFAKAQASNQGWQYSPALTQVLQKYKVAEFADPLILRKPNGPKCILAQLPSHAVIAHKL